VDAKSVKVAVLGWYGHRNFGDELLLEGLKQLFSGWEILVFSDNQKSSFPMIDFNAVNNCDLFVLGGGELINTDRLFIHSPWVHNIKIPKIILGCGVNAEKAKQLKKDVLKDLEQFSYIGLRDGTAESILKSIPKLKDKTHLFYDLVFSVDTNGFSWRNSTNAAVVIPTDRHTNRSDKGIREYNLAKKTQKWLIKKLATYEKAVFLPFGQEDNNDYETSLKLSRCIKKSEILQPNMLTPSKVYRLISESAIVLPYRLHGLVLAYLLGAKYEFYPYHWKLNRVNETITQLPPSIIRQKQKECFKEALEIACA
jgi:polysaccharide pyruvyl transferase WcaK-like protein